MRELTQAEMGMVNGGRSAYMRDVGDNFTNAGYAIIGISTFSPLTALFGYPIGGALIYLGSSGGWTQGH